MDIKRIFVIYIVANIYLTAGQQLFSSFLHVVPTTTTDKIQFYYHLSWKEKSLASGTCITPVCLRVYKLTNKTAQFFGRFTGFQWSCYKGCARTNVISDLSSLMFTEVRSYAGVKWEAGEEVVVYPFSAADDDEITIRLQVSNSTYSHVIEDARFNLGIRKDTNRTNISPSVSVLPLYMVPLGCSLDITLSTYDGDGDHTVCKWNTSMPSAHLDKTSCKITLHATSANGYQVGHQYKGSVYLEDYSSVPVNISRNGKSSFTSGPFSSVPVMFTVHVTKALTHPSSCSSKPRFKPRDDTVARSYPALSNYSASVTTSVRNATILTVGHQGTIFQHNTNNSGTTETAGWALSANDTGVYRTCFMLYDSDGVPGETICDTLLAGDTDECARNDTCIDKPCRHCTNYWHYYTCYYDSCEEKQLSIGLIIGAAIGCVILLVAMATAICLYLKYVKRKRNKVKELTITDKQELK